MGLFGDKCARCGRRTKNAIEDVPTCEECQHALELKVKAEQEDVRKCPVDGAPMKKEINQMIIIDRCPTCSGVWLDGGELDRIRAVDLDSILSVTLRGMPPHM